MSGQMEQLIVTPAGMMDNQVTLTTILLSQQKCNTQEAVYTPREPTSLGVGFQLQCSLIESLGGLGDKL